MVLMLVGVAALLVGGLFYWLFIATEGTYLGRGLVTLLYDWTARRYEAIKQTRQVDEILFLGAPLAERLAPLERPRVLDVAAGTGRLLRALGAVTEVVGIGGDRSRRMLAEAARLAGPSSDVTLVQMDGARLPFCDHAFDAVTCLEALEFLPDAPRALAEAWRVLRPGGALLVTNRVGPDALLFPFRIAGRGRMERALAAAGFARVETAPWQVHYDLIWAEKPARPAGVGVEEEDG